MMKLAFKLGINSFDNADAYGEGLAEKNMGIAVQKGVDEGVWSREDLAIATKVGLGTKGFRDASGPNDQGLTRKHIIEATKASLKRFDLEYVDVIYCIRPDVCTPMEETVHAKNFVLEQGWAFYWGTSQWSVAQIVEACDVADRLGLVRPVVEQCVYNLLDRTKVEFEYADLYKKYKLGLSTWSPLSGGLLTGKHSQEIVKGSRMDGPLRTFFAPDFVERQAKADKLQSVAAELGISLTELALAWCISNENVSAVMIGAKNLAQLELNLKALPAFEKTTPEVKAQIDALVPFVPQLPKSDGLENRRTKFL
ncbi:hypothetical protein PHYSODRAFT_333099 [Phytophthora sojae]|uniref:NADP-dependent oxidoreductase domain-containing protein n=1 Tax=Phytophthora sojae (strain P6497) TaxID=1094619 RepID=G4ZNN9_PHYSP|nr:hypothetical protein PHYSODRAFT_255178 [Phytophthora sojae]XP_009528517.1 hypothetical protein PHYSODRAFT_333099 [Phytophthora sojae]EGZ14720.1 hypothetical protein PHYSODRAFT_255178 [Phytophthora sojae]EGZ14768.1 hypothetical protein PHYSODRAFT_333099 [Phytophthora sojae]|eukprot:XP_009528469.1 hypothetical protein PHYSODRAFT_255178 [Phytophthora sojae]